MPNGDFEQYSACPSNPAEINLCLFWINPAAGSADYLNQCSWGLGVPSNLFGYEFAQSGVAYAGIVLLATAATDFREYIEVPLTSPLQTDSCYHFEMYLSLGEVYSRYSTDDIGVYFSNTLVTNITNYLPLPFTPQIDNVQGNYPDSSGWNLVSGNYTATGGESYLIIGNFKDNLNTDTILYNNSILAEEAYVFVDNVSLTKIPCITGIESAISNPQSAITISPNPFTDKITITNKNSEEGEIILYDIASRKLLQQKFTNSTSINTAQLAKGIYLYDVRNKNGVIRNGKVVKE